MATKTAATRKISKNSRCWIYGERGNWSVVRGKTGDGFPSLIVEDRIFDRSEAVAKCAAMNTPEELQKWEDICAECHRADVEDCIA